MNIEIEKTPATKFKDIDFCDSLDSYEWDEFHVMRGNDGYLYTAAGQGCSCYGFYSYFSSDTDIVSGFEYDIDSNGEPVKCDSWVQVLNNIKKWAAEGYDDSRDGVAFALMSRIADLKPAAFDPSVVAVVQED